MLRLLEGSTEQLGIIIDKGRALDDVIVHPEETRKVNKPI